MRKGLSLLYKPADTNTDNTLITMLGMPSYNESWQDYIASRIINILALQLPNCHKLSVVNNEGNFIKGLMMVGLITSNQFGSIQNSNFYRFTEKVIKKAEQQNVPPVEIVAPLLNARQFPGDAHFYDNVVFNLRNPSEAPIFDFSNKNAEPLIKIMQEYAEEAIWQILSTKSKFQYVIWKNAIITGDNKPIFTAPEYNNFIILDTTHCTDGYLENWKYLDINEYLPAFNLIASNQDPSIKGEASVTHILDTLDIIIIPKTLNVLVNYS